MNPVDRMPLGPVGYGTAQFGNLYQESSDETAAEAVAAAWQLGVRYFDTAPHYGLGASERRLGLALRTRPRSEFVVSSKVGRLLVPNPEPRGRDEEFLIADDLVREWDFSAAGVRRSVEESLQRLGLDQLDIALLHDPDVADRMDQAIGEAVPELERMKSEGLIRAWGAGMNSTAAPARIARECDPDLLMIAGQHTLLRQRGREDLLPICRAKGIRIAAAGVFNSGILAVPDPDDDALLDYAPAGPAVLARVRAMAALCREHGTTLPAAAIAFPLLEPAVVTVVLGMHDAEQVRQNLAAAAERIDQELFERMRAEGLLESGER